MPNVAGQKKDCLDDFERVKKNTKENINLVKLKGNCPD